MKLGVLAGEASGGILGEAIARELHARHSHLAIEGIGGPLLEQQGLRSIRGNI